jgi:hypothetical protein
LSVQKEQAGLFVVPYFPRFPNLVEFCNYFSVASVVSGRQYLFTSLCLRFVTFYYEGIWPQGAGSYWFPKLLVRDTHSAGSLRGDIRYRRASFCFPTLDDSDRYKIRLVCNTSISDRDDIV